MRLVLNITKGDHVLARRRSFLVVYLLGIFVMIILGFLLDASPTPRPALVSYTEIFLLASLILVLSVATPGVLYSLPRFSRRRAIARVRPHRGLLLDLYLTRELQAFVEMSTPLRPNTVVESVTLEFLPEGVKIWHGAGRPRAAIVGWPHFPALRLLETSQVELTSPDAGQRPFGAFVPSGVLGIRRHGLQELITAVEDWRP